MAFEFPTEPIVGTVFTAADGVTKYYWTGTVWMIGSAAAAAAALAQKKKS